MNIDFLKQFIKQTKTGSFKTKEYPREFLDLKMKVSFGKGALAHIPWVALHAPDLPVSSGYYPVYLFYKEQNILILTYGISETNVPEKSWTPTIHENKTKISNFIQDPFRYGDSFVHSHYQPKVEGHEVVFYRENQKISEEMIRSELLDLVNFYKGCLDLDVKDETSSISSGLFYLESQLEDFLIENWNETDFGKKYELIFESGELKSQQYKTDIGRIDILARNKSDKSYVVIELKRNQTSDDTVGQVTRYMGWVQEEFGDNNVSGVIVPGKYDEKLYYAQKMLKNIEVFLYEVNFKLNEYKK